jgi:hypothetical protein
MEAPWQDRLAASTLEVEFLVMLRQIRLIDAEPGSTLEVVP